jgi:hypothetical protein
MPVFYFNSFFPAPQAANYTFPPPSNAPSSDLSGAAGVVVAVVMAVALSAVCLGALFCRRFLKHTRQERQKDEKSLKKQKSVQKRKKTAAARAAQVSQVY